MLILCDMHIALHFFFLCSYVLSRDPTDPNFSEAQLGEKLGPLAVFRKITHSSPWPNTSLKMAR